MSVLSRVIFDPDTTPPSTPTQVAATALSQTTIRITWAASTDTGGSGLAGYRVLRSTTSTGTYTQVGSDLSTASLIYDDTSLSAGQQRFYRVVAFDGRANVSSNSSTVNATTLPSSGGNVGTVGSYAALNLSTSPIYSIDMGLRDYFLFATQAVPFIVDGTGGLAGSGSQTHVTSGWWDNSAYCRILPPTTDQYERGIYLGNLHRSGTLGIQDFNLRFETRYGPSVPSVLYNNSSGSKYSLIHCTQTLAASPVRDARPVFFQSPMSTADNSSFNRANTVVWAPSQNTFSAYGDQVYADSFPPLTFYANGAQSHYIVDSTDGVASFQSKPIFRGGDFWTVEYRIQSTSTASYPRGLIAYRVTNQAGQTVERGIPFNYDTAFALNQYIYEVQQFGCGQWNQALPAGANVYFDIGGYITVARNYNGWLGPRTGFVS